jgi:hypothetical protein
VKVNLGDMLTHGLPQGLIALLLAKMSKKKSRNRIKPVFLKAQFLLKSQRLRRFQNTGRREQMTGLNVRDRVKVIQATGFF